mgnify:FL=1
MIRQFKILSFVILMITSSITYPQANTLTTQIQIMLNELNFNAGPEDGIYGKQTKAALVNFYRKNNKIYDGNVSKNEFTDLSAKMPKSFSKDNFILKVSNTPLRDSFIKNTLNLKDYSNDIKSLNAVFEKND